MGSMRIRTLAGPPLPHELLAATVRAILLSNSLCIEGPTMLQPVAAPAEQWCARHRTA